MTSTTSTPTPSSSFSINPTNLQIGQQVDIESRTWPGINKPGGHATIIKLHYDDTTAAAVPTKIDVKYVLGGSEKQIELMYVKPHVELVRGGRSRRVDRKMTVDSFGSEKENLGKKKMMNSAAGNGGMNTNKRKNVDNVVDKSVMKKKTKKDVQNNKKKKEEDDVVPAATTKNEGEKLKVIEDDDIHQKKKQKSAPPKKMGKKKATVIAAAGGATKTKSIASYFTTSSSSAKTTKASSSSTELSVKAKATTGPSKPKETIKKVKKTTIPTTTNNNKPINTKNPKQLVKYSPNSILAVRAAHAKSPAQSHIFGTKTIGMCKDFTITSSSPGETTIPGVDKNKKKSRRGVQESLFPDDEVEEKQKSCASASSASVTTAVGSSLVLAPKKKVTPSSSSSVASGKKCGVSSSAQNHKTIQSLYKNECVKAQDFVKSMIGSEPQMEEEEEGEEEEDVTSSPESCLELKMDSGRMDLFNSLLSEVMFRKGIESMDVDEMICSINTSSRRGDTVKPFTLLEVKAFLQTLDSQNRIFVSWEDDNSGTIYSI
mmetsp:Transcript_26476/g.43711  ORF Transcript_26476/g.43711 Transcript_26476/m.43711 type:complete len:543 (-) Transcript_26476:1205-2833(-)